MSDREEAMRIVGKIRAGEAITFGGTPRVDGAAEIVGPERYVNLADGYVKPHMSGGHQVKGFFRKSVTTEGGATHTIHHVAALHNESLLMAPEDRTHGFYGVHSVMDNHGNNDLAHGRQERQVGISAVDQTDPSYHGYTHRATIHTIGLRGQSRILYGPGKEPVVEGVGAHGTAKRVTKIKPLAAEHHVASAALLHHVGLSGFHSDY